MGFYFLLGAINYESRYEKLKIDYSGRWKTNLNAAVGLMRGLLPPLCQTKPITTGQLWGWGKWVKVETQDYHINIQAKVSSGFLPSRNERRGRGD